MVRAISVLMINSYTGNCLNILPIKPMLTFGIGKGATASAIRAAVANKEYGKEGIKFYYADERTAEGGPVLKGPDGEVSDHSRVGVMWRECADDSCRKQGRCILSWRRRRSRGIGIIFM